VSTGKKWLFSDPIFLVAIVLLGCFNYVFDQMFRELVLAMPQLMVPYIFQYNLILPVIDIGFLLITFRAIGLLKERKKNEGHSFKRVSAR
jgi:hypothetical protein